MTIEEKHDMNVQRWNVESLKEYIDTVISKHEELNDQKFLMTKEAVLKAEQAADVKLDNLNHLQKQMDKQAETYLTKDVYTAEHKYLTSKVESVTKLVYIGIGILTIVEIAVGFILALLLHT